MIAVLDTMSTIKHSHLFCYFLDIKKKTFQLLFSAGFNLHDFEHVPVLCHLVESQAPRNMIPVG